MFLLLGLAAPVFVVAAVPSNNESLTLLDLTIAATFLGLVIIETVADNQQEEFQNTKKMLIKDGYESTAPFQAGFISWGLFSLSRHPNYVAEQLLWVIFYLFSVSATGSMINITLTGPILLILLFQGSTALSESITASKYHGYAKYKTIVPRFIGNFWSLRSSYTAIIAEKFEK